MEARAIKRYSKGSPRKMRQVVDLIRNQTVHDAVAILKFSKNHSAEIVEKAVVSAYHNLENKLDTGRLSQDDVFVSEAFVNGGPSYKRILPAPQGRAFRIRKRTAHLTIIVSNGEEEEVVEDEILEDEEEAVEETTKKAPKKASKEKKSKAKAKKKEEIEEDDDVEESEEVEEIEDEVDENPIEEEEDDAAGSKDDDGEEAEEEEQELNK